MKLYTGGRYFITKKNKKYFLYDSLKLEFDDNFDYLSIRKNNHVISHMQFNQMDDWYADIGAIYHTKRFEIDLGKIVFETNIEERAIKELKERSE